MGYTQQLSRMQDRKKLGKISYERGVTWWKKKDHRDGEDMSFVRVCRFVPIWLAANSGAIPLQYGMWVSRTTAHERNFRKKTLCWDILGVSYHSSRQTRNVLATLTFRKASVIWSSRRQKSRSERMKSLIRLVHMIICSLGVCFAS